MDRLAERTGRQYRLVDYHGHSEAERVLVIMGSGAQTARETVAFLAARGERVGVAQVRLYRPFPADALIAALPASVRRVAVLDRTKEPGSEGEPLFLDVVAASTMRRPSARWRSMPIVIGGRCSPVLKEFTPGMVAGVWPSCSATIAENASPSGSSTTSPTQACPSIPLDVQVPETVRAVFYGLGSDSTVGANKNTIKILGDEGLYAQGYFVYDSKKSGSQATSPPVSVQGNLRAVLSSAGQLCRLLPVRAARACRGARAGGARRGAAPQLAASCRQGVGPALPPGPGADLGQGIAALCDQCRAHCSRSWAGRPD